MILLGGFMSDSFSKVYVIIAATGVILAAVYMLWMFQRVMFGKLDNPKNQTLTDLSLREIVVLVPIVVFIIWIGVYPKPFLNRMEKSVSQVLQQSRSTAAVEAAAPAIVLDTTTKEAKKIDE
jgi:NADH-quinone oxidoreductase subunit M